MRVDSHRILSLIHIFKVDEDGYVYIVDAGKAVITAMATDGSGVKAKCTVTVIDDADTDDEDDDE